MMQTQLTVHFCPKCGHAFNEHGVLADGGYGCSGPMSEVSLSQWGKSAMKWRSVITDAGRAALRTTEQEEGPKP